MARIYYGWAVVAVSTIANLVLVGAFYSSYGLFVLPVSQEFHLSRADANTGLVILSLGIAIQAPFLGRLADRVSVRRIMIVGSLLFAASLATLAVSHSLLLNAVVLAVVFPLAVQGAVALTTPLLIARWFTAQRARAMILAQLGLSLGGVVLPPMVGAMIDGQGWRVALLVTGAVAGLTLLAMALVVRDWPAAGEREGRTAAPVVGPAPPPLTVREIVRDVQFWTINLSGALIIGTSIGVSISLAPLARGAGMSTVEAATIISVMAASGTVGKLILAGFGDRIERVALLAFLFLAGAAANAAILVSHHYLFLLAAVAPLGLLQGATTPLLNAVIADRFGPSSFGTITGLAQPLQSAASMIGVRYAGEIFDRTGSYDLLFVSVIAVQAIAALMMFATRFARAPAAAAAAKA